MALTTGLHVATPVGLEKHITWRKALTGGGMAFAGLAVVASGFMGLRSMGVGPAATLMTSGVFDEQEELILAHFANRTTDSTLGPTVTELVRVSLSQSTVVRLLDPARISESLTRMQRQPDAPVPESIALEIAERDGFKAVLAGEIAPLGQGYLVSARVLSATGNVLAAQQASASGPDGLISAVDELTGKLRERIGESLRTIRRTVPLDFITTGSIDALRLYTQGAMAEVAGDLDRALDLLEEAVQVDSAFAMAYRKIGTILQNDGEDPARAIEAVTRAFELRERLTERERAYAAAQYHSAVTGDVEAALGAYRTLLETYPDDHRATNNSGVLYFQIGDFQRAMEYWSAGVDADSTWPIGFTNAAYAQTLTGDSVRGRETLEGMQARFEDNPLVTEGFGDFAYMKRDYDDADRHWREVLADQSSSPRWQTSMQEKLGNSQITRGRLRTGIGQIDAAIAGYERRALPAAALVQTLVLAEAVHATRGPAAAREIVEAALTTFPVEDMPVANRPYDHLATFYAEIGDLPSARQTVQEMEQSGQVDLGEDFRRGRRRALGWIAVQDGRFDEGIREYRAGAVAWACHPCRLTAMAQFFDAAGQADSALAYWQQYADLLLGFVGVDAAQRARGFVRLGELLQEVGDTERAVRYYGDFVDLWEGADAELQPQVDDVRGRIARLVGEGRQ